MPLGDWGGRGGGYGGGGGYGSGNDVHSLARAKEIQPDLLARFPMPLNSFSAFMLGSSRDRSWTPSFGDSSAPPISKLNSNGVHFARQFKQRIADYAGVGYASALTEWLFARINESRTSLLAISENRGVTFYSGHGAGWTVPSHSPLVPYAARYDLDTITAVFDGTPEAPLGKAIDFAGPNTQRPPYFLTIDMGTPMAFTHWRVAGHRHYRFGLVHLKYLDMATGEFAVIGGSECDYDKACEKDGFAYGTFDVPITAQVWQVCITSYANNNNQAKFQCYLTEAQFGHVEARQSFRSRQGRDSHGAES